MAVKRLYDVGNKANTGMWIVAPDEHTAKLIALKERHAKKIENLRATDVTDTARGIEDILVGPNGVCYIEIQGVGTALDFFNSLKSGIEPAKPKSGWVCREVKL